ncbi:MAG TPA: oxidoreductase [Pyrinomonadaceae bacterium]
MANSPPLKPDGAPRRVVALAGATGLVGRAILQGLLADPSVASVHALGRREPDVAHPKLIPHVVDFAALPTLPPLDEVYLALGTTIKVAGNQSAFRAVDFEANLSVARAALAAGARRAGLVSAMGADAKSRVFYNRVKGELEESLARLPFDGLVIARPSLLVGDREALRQPKRPVESAATIVCKLLGPLVPKNYRPIAASDVARALLARVAASRGRVVLLSGEMQG